MGITYLAALVYIFNARYVYVTDFFIRYCGMVLYLLLLFLFSILSVAESRKLENRLIEDLEKVLCHKCKQECPEITVFLKSNPEKITGKIIDLFDKKAIKLEKAGEKFLIPWEAIGLIKINPKLIFPFNQNLRILTGTQNPES